MVCQSVSVSVRACGLCRVVWSCACLCVCMCEYVWIGFHPLLYLLLTHSLTPPTPLAPTDPATYLFGHSFTHSLTDRHFNVPQGSTRQHRGEVSGWMDGRADQPHRYICTSLCTSRHLFCPPVCLIAWPSPSHPPCFPPSLSCVLTNRVRVQERAEVLGVNTH